jgi:uncharacterized protein (AIM24 family)
LVDEITSGFDKRLDEKSREEKMPSQVFLVENGQQSGPFTEEQIQQMMGQGRLHPGVYCWYEGLAGWQPINSALPGCYPQPAAPPVAQTAPQPPAQYAAQPAAQPAVQPAAQYASAYGGTTEFEVITSEYHRMPKITLNNAEVVLEAGLLHYMLGNITIESELPSVGGFLKSALTKEKAVRPRYKGTGTVYLEPTFGECNLIELNGEEWILDKGAFMACESTVQIGMFTNKAWTGLFGGEGFFQTTVSGRGKVLYFSQGPVETIHLNGAPLVVDGSFAVARTASVQYKLERATKKFFGSWTSGEGMVNTFSGTGTVLIAPYRNRFLTLMYEFGGLHAAIRRVSKSG